MAVRRDYKEPAAPRREHVGICWLFDYTIRIHFFQDKKIEFFATYVPS